MQLGVGGWKLEVSPPSGLLTNGNKVAVGYSFNLITQDVDGNTSTIFNNIQLCSTPQLLNFSTPQPN